MIGAESAKYQLLFTRKAKKDWTLQRSEMSENASDRDGGRGTVLRSLSYLPGT
jgi:hypothetical protein